MKFDLIIGNPPFQEGGRDDQANKLWPHFIKKEDLPVLSPGDQEILLKKAMMKYFGNEA